MPTSAVLERTRHRLREVGDEPDPRFTLAEEPTFLAWTRTALGLLVTGLAGAELLDSESHTARLVIGVSLVLMAGVMGVIAICAGGRSNGRSG